MRKALTYFGALLIGVALASAASVSALGTIFIVQQGGTGVGANGVPMGDLMFGEGPSSSAFYLLSPCPSGDALVYTASSTTEIPSCGPYGFSTSTVLNIMSTGGYLASTSLSATYPLAYNSSTGVFSTVATSSERLTTSAFASPNISQWTNDAGYVTASGAQAAISLTTTGSSGAATYSGGVLNIPQYSGGSTYSATYPIVITGSTISTPLASTTLAQTYGTAQSGAITLGTSSLSFNGLTFADSITNSGASFTFKPIISGTLSNSGLANTGTTVNGQTCTLGSSCTVASTTLLANNNTFSGNNLLTASTTIGGGAAATGLTVNGGATTSSLVVGSNYLVVSPTGIVGVNTLSQASTFNVGGSINLTSSLALNGTVALTYSGSNLTFGNGWAQVSLAPTLTTINQASSTLLSNIGTAYFGGTSTTTIDSAGNIVFPSGATITHTGTSNGCATWASGVLGTTGSACGTSGGITALGNYATTSGTTISLSTTTETTNGVTQGINIAASANGLLFTPSISGTLSNAGLAHSTIVLNSQTLTLGDTNDTITAASSTLLANNNTWTGLQNFSNATSTLLSAGAIWDTGQASAGCAQFSSAGFLSSTGTACGSGSGTNYWTSSGVNITQNTGSSITFGYLIATSTATSTITNFEGVLYADNFSGADIGAKINAAYAALPTTGGTIVVPAGKYSFSNEINFSTLDKPVSLQCSPGGGTLLTWTGGANSTSTVFNTGDTGADNGTFFAAQGISGCDFSGPNTGGTNNGTVGLSIGGSQGAPNTQFTNLHILGFGTAIVSGNNTWNMLVSASAIEFNNQDYIDEGNTNEGENMRFDFDIFSSCNTVAKCVYLPTSAAASVTFSQDAFDDAQLYVSDGNFETNINGGHFENPNQIKEGQYTYVVFDPTNNGYSQMDITGAAFVNDATTTTKSPYQLITNGGSLNLQSIAIDGNGGVPVPAVVGSVNTTFQSLNAQNVYEIGAGGVGYTNVSTSSTLFMISPPGSSPTGNFVGVATSTNYLSSSLNVGGTENIDGNLDILEAANVANYATLSFNGTSVSDSWPETIANWVTSPEIIGSASAGSNLTIEGNSSAPHNSTVENPGSSLVGTTTANNCLNMIECITATTTAAGTQTLFNVATSTGASVFSVTGAGVANLASTFNLTGNLNLTDSAITTTDNSDESIGTNWGWYINGDATHPVQVTGGSLVVGQAKGFSAGASLPTTSIFDGGTLAVGTSTAASWVTQGASYNSVHGVCFMVKATGSASSYVYYYYTAAATQVISATTCAGAATTTVIID